MRKAPPIPSFMLRQTVLVRTCTGVDAWQNPVYSAQEVDHVCVQPSSKTVTVQNNTQMQCSTMVYIDTVRSSRIDMNAVERTSNDNGHRSQIVFENIPRDVLSVDTLYNPDGTVHHWEVGLI